MSNSTWVQGGLKCALQLSPLLNCIHTLQRTELSTIFMLRWCQPIRFNIRCLRREFEWEWRGGGYLFPCVFTSICQILNGRSYRLQSGQTKARENAFLYCFASARMEPGTSQSWVFCIVNSLEIIVIIVQKMHTSGSLFFFPSSYL